MVAAKKKKKQDSGWNEAGGIILISLAILLVLSIFSYNPGDIAFLNSPPNSPPVNFIGPVGAYGIFTLFMAIGLATYVIPLVLAAIGVFCLLQKGRPVGSKGLALGVFTIALACVLELQIGRDSALVEKLNLGSAGGVVGHFIGSRFLSVFIGEIGTLIVGWGLILASIVVVTEKHPKEPIQLVWGVLKRFFSAVNGWVVARLNREDARKREEDAMERKRKRLEKSVAAEEEQARKTRKLAEKKKDEQKQAKSGKRAEEKKSVAKAKKKSDPKTRPKAEEEEFNVPEIDGVESNFELPPISILDKLPPASKRSVKVDVKSSRKILEETLREFNIEAEVTGVDTGPVVTRYEILPPPGIRVEKIAGLSNNIALALKAETVRVQAPIPGKGVVGIEVPNTKSDAVYLREVLESDEWQGSGAALPLALGKDVSGNVVVADLADMPHLLVAGATGAGKTVCMNSILTGLLMTRRPEEMRLMLIDPKIVEFSSYNHLPHLVVPVITDPKKVGLGFRWVINEMEKRYKMFNKAGVRNIKAFNSRKIAKQTEMFVEGEENGKTDDLPRTVPYILVVVDELADLMSVAQAEIENSIARLAQLSRAVGIHMILATQRPSVNIITGTIKANFPARIAFQVAQKVDSRTIIDAVGADKLLGKGDLLFLPPGSSKLVRSQGAFTNDDEINRVIEFLKNQGNPEYETEVKEKIEGKKADVPEMDEDDDLLSTAIEVIRQTRRASTSSLQRRLRIGYTRAARLMDILEEKGVIGSPQGSEPREILIDLDGDIPENADDVQMKETADDGEEDADGAADEPNKGVE